MKENIGKWISILVLVLLLIIIIRGYILQVQESDEDKDLRRQLLQTRLNRV